MRFAEIECCLVGEHPQAGSHVWPNRIAYGETYRQYAGDIKNIDVIEFPLWWVTSFMVYGFVFAAYQFARQAITGNIVQRSEV